MLFRLPFKGHIYRCYIPGMELALGFFLLRDNAAGVKGLSKPGTVQPREIPQTEVVG